MNIFFMFATLYQLITEQNYQNRFGLMYWNFKISSFDYGYFMRSYSHFVQIKKFITIYFNKTFNMIYVSVIFDLS